MPFGERTMSEQRASLVKEIEIGERSLSALCLEYGVSRPTAYKWLSRSRQGESMESRSRAPLNSPNKTSSFLESVILRARERHPCWGGRKLKAYLERQFGAPRPFQRGIFGQYGAGTKHPADARKGQASEPPRLDHRYRYPRSNSGYRHLE